MSNYNFVLQIPLISNEDGKSPFWNNECMKIQSDLWLPHTQTTLNNFKIKKENHWQKILIPNQDSIENSLLNLSKGSIVAISENYQERIVKILQRKNSETIMAVRSADGMDELSTTSKNQICMLKNNIITKMILDPQKIGLQKGNISDIQIKSKEDAIKSFVTVLDGSANKTKIEITALNAAGGLIVSDIADSFTDAVELALNAIHSGKAFDKLENFVKNCGDIKKLEEVKKL